MGHDNGYFKAIQFHIILFSQKTISFPSRIAILHTKRNLRV
jgi:hypothetical protein